MYGVVVDILLVGWCACVLCDIIALFIVMYFAFIY